MQLNRQRVSEHFPRVATVHGSAYTHATPVGHLLTTRLDRVAELLGGLQAAQVLDVGCGPGMVAGQLLESGCTYYGVDLTIETLYECRARLGHSSRAHCDVAEAEHLPFSDHSFQTVLALGVLEYVSDLDAAVHEMSRVLVADGTVILSMQNAFSPYRLWQRYGYHNRLLFGLLRFLARRAGPGPLLETASSFRHIRTVLEHHRFEVVDVVFYDFNLWVEPLDRFFPRLSIATSRRLEWLRRSPLRGLGSGFIVKAKLHQEPSQ